MSVGRLAPTCAGMVLRFYVVGLKFVPISAISASQWRLVGGVLPAMRVTDDQNEDECGCASGE